MGELAAADLLAIVGPVGVDRPVSGWRSVVDGLRSMVIIL
jgi:hypothetical protein